MNPTQHIELFERLERARLELDIAQKHLGSAIPEAVGDEARRLVLIATAINTARTHAAEAVDRLDGV